MIRVRLLGNRRLLVVTFHGKQQWYLDSRCVMAGTPCPHVVQGQLYTLVGSSLLISAKLRSTGILHFPMKWQLSQVGVTLTSGTAQCEEHWN